MRFAVPLLLHWIELKYFALVVCGVATIAAIQEAVVVGAGGGSGLSNISWGANKSIAIKAKKALEELGFMEK